MKKVVIWIVAVAITLGAAIYQRKTGPTYERVETVQVGGQEYEIDLKRSNGPRDLRIKLPFEEGQVNATVFYKRLNTSDEWTAVPFEMKDIRYHGWFMTKVLKYQDERAMVAYLPVQPPAGKLEYYLQIDADGQTQFIGKEEHVVARFKDDVPAGVLIPHVILMFLSMLFATVAGLFAAFKIERFKRWTKWTFWILLFGGFLFGPWVQWHAFGDWWTGIPFGWDLTDNKTLFAFIFWIVAFFANRKKSRPGLVILAAVMTLVIFSIPHSLFGSELDYATGSVTQG